jgi:hypothetical protein
VAVAESTIATSAPDDAAMIGAAAGSGAAQQERVDRRARRPREDRLAVAASRSPTSGASASATAARRSAAQLARLDQRDQRRRRVLVDLDAGFSSLIARSRRASGSWPGSRSRPTRRLRVARPRPMRRPDDAEDRQVVAPPKRPSADGGRGVAGDDDRLDVALGEQVERLGRERQDLLVGRTPYGARALSPR